MILILPIGSVQTCDTLEEAKATAFKLTEQYGKDAGGWAIFDAKEIGRYEHASPIWIEESQWLDSGTPGETVRVDVAAPSGRADALAVPGRDKEAERPARL